MSLINCPDCSNEMSDAARACPKCGRPNQNIAPVKRSISILLGVGILLFPLIFSWFTLRSGHSVLSRIIAFSWLVLSFVLVGIGDDVSTNTYTSTQSQTYQVKDTLTRAQKNAVRSAKQYLNMMGFSRKGLIQQLSSGAGDGYHVTDATTAIDSMNINWNKQAVRSAQQYLSMMGFSCDGLIEQLSSSAGENYTVSQATYGARESGACP